MVSCQYLGKVGEISKKIGQERRTIYKFCCDVRRFLEIWCNCGHGGETIEMITQQGGYFFESEVHISFAVSQNVVIRHNIIPV